MALESRIPRSTTAWLIASVSVAFSAINPNQINNRFIALNIGFLSAVAFSFCLFSSRENLCHHLRRPASQSTRQNGPLAALFLSRFLVLQQDFFLQDEFELAVELLFVGCANDRRAEFFDRVEYFRIHIERDKMC